MDYVMLETETGALDARGAWSFAENLRVQAGGFRVQTG